MLRQLFTLVPWPPATWKYLIVLLLIDVVIGVDLWRMRQIRLLRAYNQNINLNLSGSTVTKDELRAELERQEQRYKEVYGGEVTTYAAQPEPERKPWRKRATVQDQAFTQELQKMEKELKAEEP